MLIDFHTHCFPDKIAAAAIEKLSLASGGLEPYTDGTAQGLQQLMRAQGVDKAVVLNIATNARQQKNVNDFAAALNTQPNLIAFGSVYPYSEDALDELERICALGLKGVKLHPDYQGFAVDDIRLKPLYRKISALGLITVFHAGADYGFPPPYGGTPERLATALQWLDSPVVAAHWGGIDSAPAVIQHLCGKNVYLDTSFGYGMMPRYYAQKIVEKHGTDKLLFGTDAPWHTAQMEMRLLRTLSFTPDEWDAITEGNATRLLK